MAGDGGSDAGAAFRAEGGNALVVGDVPKTVHQSFARALVGDRERRLLVLAGRSIGDVDRYLVPGTPRDPDHLRVIEHELTTRSTATDGGDVGGVDESVVDRVPGDDLAGLGATISEAVDAFDAVAGGLDPGELGTCFDSIGAVVAEHGETDVFGFLHILTERLDRVDATTTVHLPVEADDSSVRMFESLFDAVVELRLDGDRSQCRWDVGDGTGEWCPVESRE